MIYGNGLNSAYYLAFSASAFLSPALNFGLPTFCLYIAEQKNPKAMYIRVSTFSWVVPLENLKNGKHTTFAEMPMGLKA